MVIQKILNHNTVIVKDDCQEIVVMGKGIAYSKKVGDAISESLIEKKFTMDKPDTQDKLRVLLEHVPEEVIYLTSDLVDYIQNSLGSTLNEYLYITLADHINNVVNLYNQGIQVSNPLYWEIKKFYPKEFKVSVKVLEYINEEMCVNLNEEESANITMHIINSFSDGNIQEQNMVQDIITKIKDILNIIKYVYKISIDEESLNYLRFVTHLRFFFQRIEEKRISSESDVFLLNQVKEKYVNAYNCSKKIEDYLGIKLNESEMLYLVLHVNRITTSE